jgi:hypothetical protein
VCAGAGDSSAAGSAGAGGATGATGASAGGGTTLESVAGAGGVVPSAGGRLSADVPVSVPVTGVVPSPPGPLLPGPLLPPEPLPEPLPEPWLPVAGSAGSVPGSGLSPWPGAGARGP